MKTKSERFVEQKREDWKVLLDILTKISKQGMKKLSIEESEMFPRLYRKTCQDLAEARMLGLSPDVLAYLNNMTGQAHHYLYFMKPLTKSLVITFFKKDLPETLIKNYKYVIFTLILFWGIAFASYFVISQSPEMASNFVSEDTLQYLEDMYRDPISKGRTGGQRAQMAAFYIQHNTSIAFLCFATGIFLGLGSLYFLIYNGIFLGTIIGYLNAQGMGAHIFEFITAHSFLELNAIAIAGAAGLKLGFSLLHSWKSYSTKGLKKSRSDILVLLSSAAILLFLAALVEGMISPSTLDSKYKIFILLCSIVLMIFYFLVYPLSHKRHK